MLGTHKRPMMAEMMAEDIRFLSLFGWVRRGARESTGILLTLYLLPCTLT